MMKRMRTDGFSAVGIVVIIAVVAAVGLGGWYVWNKNKSDESKNNSTSQSSSTTPNNGKTKKQSDPSEDGKYLVITEWGVRVALPADLKGAVTYSLGETMADPDGNQLQAAKILIANSSLTENACATSTTSLGAAVESGAQYIRSEISKPFNASRYRWTFKENILTNGANAYHLNYVTPDCIGGGTNATKVETLQNSLVQLTKVE